MRGGEPNSPVILQRLTDEFDRETIPVFIDKMDHFRRFGSSFDVRKAEEALNDILVPRISLFAQRGLVFRAPKSPNFVFF